MHVGFLLDADGQVSTTHGTQATDMSYAYIERAGAQTFRPFGYLGFRYLQIDAPGEPLGRDQVVAYAVHAAMPDGPAAQFHASNPDARRGVEADGALGALLVAGAVPRHADP